VGDAAPGFAFAEVARTPLLLPILALWLVIFFARWSPLKILKSLVPLIRGFHRG
jgi:hypothetical protein